MTEKKIKYFWTGLDKPKDGKVKKDTNTIEVKCTPQTHVWLLKDDADKGTHNAPFYFRKMTGDFTCQVKLTSKTKLQTWLDQCGILIQEKRGVYAKLSLEYHQVPKSTDTMKHYVASYFHTGEREESRTPYPGQYTHGDKNYGYFCLEEGQHKDLWLKVSRLEGYLETQYSFDGEDWMDFKVGKFSEAETLSVGVFCASPGADNAGFKAVFGDLEITEDEDDDSDDDDEEEEGEEEEPMAEEPTPTKEAEPEEVAEEAEPAAEVSADEEEVEEEAAEEKEE